MRTVFKVWVCCVIGAFGFCGCSKSCRNDISNGVIYAYHNNNSDMMIDGMLNEPVWGNAQAYRMNLCCDRAVGGRELEEGGYVKFCWDEERLYVAALLKDSDIVAKGKEDHLAHFLLGDVFELYVKPSWQKWYWEMYATPLGKKTCYFLSKHRAETKVVKEVALEVGAVNYGSVNYSDDVDEAFCVEMSVPWKQLLRQEDKDFRKVKWDVLIGRYNYSKHLVNESPEYSSMPELSKTDFHLLGEYAELRLIR